MQSGSLNENCACTWVGGPRQLNVHHPWWSRTFNISPELLAVLPRAGKKLAFWKMFY